MLIMWWWWRWWVCCQRAATKQQEGRKAGIANASTLAASKAQRREANLGQDNARPMAVALTDLPFMPARMCSPAMTPRESMQCHVLWYLWSSPVRHYGRYGRLP